MTTAKLGALYVWTVSFQEKAGDLDFVVVAAAVAVSQGENMRQVPSSFLGLLGGSSQHPDAN